MLIYFAIISLQSNTKKKMLFQVQKHLCTGWGTIQKSLCAGGQALKWALK